MKENLAQYRYTNFLKITSVTDETEIKHYKDNEKFCVVHWFDFIRDTSILRQLVNR